MCKVLWTGYGIFASVHIVPVHRSRLSEAVDRHLFHGKASNKQCMSGSETHDSVPNIAGTIWFPVQYNTYKD